MIIRKRIAAWALFLLSVFMIASSSTHLQEEEAIRVFEGAGAKAEHYMLHIGSRTPRTHSAEDLSSLAKHLAGELGLNAVRKKTMADGTRYEAQGKWDRNIQVEMAVINDRPGDLFVQPYISIGVAGRGPLSTADLFDTRARLLRTLHKFKMDAGIHFSIQGTVPFGHRVEARDREELVNRVIRELEATEVESMRTERTTSVSAHTPLFNGGLKTKGGTMNVQVAAKTGDHDRQVILTLGTPIITIEY